MNLLEKTILDLGELIWQTTRGFQEASMLLEHIGRHMQERQQAAQAEVFPAKSRELNQRASHFQKIAIGHESLSEDNLERGQAAD